MPTAPLTSSQKEMRIEDLVGEFVNGTATDEQKAELDALRAERFANMIASPVPKGRVFRQT